MFLNQTNEDEEQQFSYETTLMRMRNRIDEIYNDRNEKSFKRKLELIIELNMEWFQLKKCYIVGPHEDMTEEKMKNLNLQFDNTETKLNLSQMVYLRKIYQK